MDFADERYVRVYVRDTATWLRLEWEGQCTLMQVLRRVDRAGVLEIGDLSPVEGVALVTRGPADFIAKGVERMLALGVCVHRQTRLVFPRFLEAQETARTTAQRKRASRERRRDQAKHGESQIVTKSHDESHAVTRGHVPAQHSTARDQDLGSSSYLSDPETSTTRAGARAEQEQQPKAPESRCEVVELRPKANPPPTLVQEPTPEAKRASKLLSEVLLRDFSAYSPQWAQHLHVLGGRPQEEWDRALPILRAEVMRKARRHSPRNVEFFWPEFYSRGESPPDYEAKPPAKSSPGEYVSTPSHYRDATFDGVRP